MNCDAARQGLLDLLEEEALDATQLGARAAALQADVARHVSSCSDCAAVAASIRHWRESASAWEDAPVPRWRPPALPRPTFWRDWRQWLPAVASAAAVALATAVLLRALAPMPAERLETHARQLVSTELAQWRKEFEQRSETDRAMLIQAMMEANRSQREQELAVLATMLKREMDRRALETEDSLRYIVSHQVQDERRLNDLFHLVGGLDQPPGRRP